MSAVVKLSTKLPGDAEINGLDSIAGELIASPDELRTAIVQYDVEKITHDTDSGTDLPTVRIRSVEDLGLVVETPDGVREAWSNAKGNRLGRKAPAFELGTVKEADPDQSTIDEV